MTEADDRFFARKTPRQARSRALVDAVIAAASRILPERGPEDLTTHHIAERAGVSIGSLYQYFPTKESIVGALIDRKLESDVAQARRWIDELEGPVATWIERMTERVVAMHRDAGPLYRSILPVVARMRRHRKVRGAVAEVREALRARVAERGDELRKDDLEIPIFLAGHAIEACVHAAVDERPELLDDPRFTRELTDLVQRYLLRDPR
ncbi:MAG: TetR/AcrR family transcriptional regulator [Sandaracinaceae bacterium]|nr:TetR/AcrR family transcriptional regulator [Sandaracinaceae bacterium]